MTRRIWIFPAAAVLLLGACAEIPPPGASRPDSGRAATASAPASPAGPADILAETGALVGRDAREVVELLGEPGLKRRDPPAEMWQYRAGPCVLDLFLYADKGSALTVAHAEVRTVPPVGGPANETARASNDAPLPGRARGTSSAECLERVRNGG
jgi:hypothetical protein